MTDSRETMRRKAFQDRATEPAPLAVPLTDLCIIRGCLTPREGNNLCTHHQHDTTPGTDSTP